MKSENGVMECWRDGWRDARSLMGARTALSAWSSVEPIGYERSAPKRGILTGRFSSFQLVSPGFSYQKKNRNREAQTLGFSATGNVSLMRALRGIFMLFVAPCCTLSHLDHSKTR